MQGLATLLQHLLSKVSIWKLNQKLVNLEIRWYLIWCHWLLLLASINWLLELILL